MLHKETIAFSWMVPEFEVKERRRNWHWIAGIIALLLVILSIIMSNYLLGFLIVLGAFIGYQLLHAEPLDLNVEISEHGIKYHNELLRYESISAFWISQNMNQKPVLILATDRSLSPKISILIPVGISIRDLREYLVEYIEEQEIQESFTDRFIEWVGF